MQPGKYNLPPINQGATYDIIIIWKPDGSVVDLSSYTAKLHMRSSKESDDILIELTTENGKIVMGVDGQINLLVPAAETKEIEWTDAVYDLLVTSPTGYVSRVIEGKVTVSTGVTR